MEASLPATYYARALRARGQDLASLFPHQLDIEQQDRSFMVRVRCDRKRSESHAPATPAEAPKSGLRNIFHKLNSIRIDKGHDTSAIDVTVDRRYTPRDISRIDEAGLQRRIRVGKIPDIHDLGEALRTIGRIVDAEEGRLVKIFRDQRRVAFEYTVKGAVKKVEMTRTELYKVQQSYYQGRSGPGNLDLWKGKD